MIKNGYYISNTLSSLITLVILLYSNHQLEAGKDNKKLKKWLLTLITLGTMTLAINLGILSCKLNCGMDIETGYPILVIFLLIQLTYIIMLLGIIYLFTQSEHVKTKPIGVLSIGLVLYLLLLGTTIYKIYNKRDRKSDEEIKREEKQRLRRDLAKKIEEQKEEREFKRNQELFEQLSQEDINYNQAENILKDRPERHLVLTNPKPEVIEEQGTVNLDRIPRANFRPNRRISFNSRPGNVGFNPNPRAYRQTPMPTSKIGHTMDLSGDSVPITFKPSIRSSIRSSKRRKLEH